MISLAFTSPAFTSPASKIIDTFRIASEIAESTAEVGNCNRVQLQSSATAIGDAKIFDRSAQHTSMPNINLPANAFRRMDEAPDEVFYRSPRLVTHIDNAAIAAVTQVYRESLPPDGAILDLMSSWISHLPPEIAYRRVVGLGMNATELSNNPRLESFVVHDLNLEPQLPFESGEFDAASICVSVDYLIKPVEVLRDLARVLKPGGVVVITFSNRCFPSKAVLVWHSLDDAGRIKLVEEYLLETGAWSEIRGVDRSPNPGRSDPLFVVSARVTPRL
jgi:SAM-dependent methyltransferase